jgi:transcriptional regulator with XRE-family HTH domain
MTKQKSMRKLAKELGISVSYLSMIQSGQRKCPPELAMKISVNSSQNNVLLASGLTSQAESREFESRLPLHCQRNTLNSLSIHGKRINRSY